MVDEKGEMKVNRETKMVVTHLRFHVQFKGLSGSWGLSQVTYSRLATHVLMVSDVIPQFLGRRLSPCAVTKSQGHRQFR